MKLLLIALMLTSGSAFAFCNTTLPSNQFYQCIERERVQDEMNQRLRRIEENQNKRNSTFCFRDSFNNLICQ